MFHRLRAQLLTTAHRSESRWVLVGVVSLLIIIAGCPSSQQQQRPLEEQIRSSKYSTLEAKQQACERGEFAECTQVGLAYIKGEGVAEDKERGLTYLRKGCDGEIPTACFSLGIKQLMEGSGADDVVRGVANIKQACDDKLGEACFFMGAIAGGQINVQGVEPKQELAESYYRKGCEYGHKESCSAAK